MITTILDPSDAPAAVLAQAYHQRWEHEEGNRQLKSALRGPGRVLRSKSPQMVEQEIYGYLLPGGFRCGCRSCGLRAQVPKSSPDPGRREAVGWHGPFPGAP